MPVNSSRSWEWNLWFPRFKVGFPIRTPLSIWTQNPLETTRHATGGTWKVSELSHNVGAISFVLEAARSHCAKPYPKISWWSTGKPCMSWFTLAMLESQQDIQSCPKPASRNYTTITTTARRKYWQQPHHNAVVYPWWKATWMIILLLSNHGYELLAKMGWSSK